MRSVLITGAAGFVGSHVTGVFREDGNWDVTELDFGINFPKEPVDVVVSLAASADPRAALEDPEFAYVNSVRIMVRTLEYAKRTGARVLQLSSNEAQSPNGPYGGSKACQEVICSAYSDVQTSIVVTQSLFGERQQRDKLVPTVIRALLSDQPVRLQGHQNSGEPQWAQRPFMYVRDLAFALLSLAYAPEPPEVIRVGATENTSVLDVARTLAATLERSANIELVEAGDRPGHELAATPIGWSMKEWSPLYKTGPALETVARWYSLNRNWL